MSSKVGQLGGGEGEQTAGKRATCRARNIGLGAPRNEQRMAIGQAEEKLPQSSEDVRSETLNYSFPLCPSLIRARAALPRGEERHNPDSASADETESAQVWRGTVNVRRGNSVSNR